jgi:hypothetical protein
MKTNDIEDDAGFQRLAEDGENKGATKQGLQRLNRWLSIVALATTLLYCAYFVYQEQPWRERFCCDGPCWNGKD